MAKSPYNHLLMLRLSGDLSTKADRTRQQFVKRLRSNLKDALKQVNIQYRLQVTRSRIFLDVDRLDAMDALTRVFGIQGISVVQKIAWTTLNDIVESAVRFHGDDVVGKQFAVRAKRGGHRRNVSVSTRQIQIAVGNALLERSAGVNLSSPEVTVHIEVHKTQAFFFTDERPGAGGLPIGSSGRALSLLSGGFDSPVASWMMLKRGINLDYVFFNLGGTPHRQGVLQVGDALVQRWARGTRPEIHEVDLRPMVEHLRENVEERLWQVILKRLMVRAATALAEEKGHSALVTGEVVGQVSSQTLQNLSVINQTTDMMILRPLVGRDKQEIVELSKHLGTHDISAMAKEYCALTPNFPATKVRLQDALEAESKLDMTRLDAAVASRITYNITNLQPDEFELNAPSIDHVPEGALVVDLRDARAWKGWHHPEAVHMPYFEALRTFRTLPKDRKIVLVCEVGLKSAGLAEAMRMTGYDAVNFKGGLPAMIKRVSEETDPLLAELLSPV